MKRTYSTNTLNSYFTVVPKRVMKGVGDDGSSRSSSSSSSQHTIVVPESLTTVSTLQASVNNDNTPEQVSAEESNEVVKIKRQVCKRTQNELIECCKDEILSVIVKKIGDAKYHSIMFDETTDIAHVSQMSIVIRYLEGINVQENFVSFIDCQSENYELSPDTLEPVLNGTILGITVMKQVQKFGLPLENCVGICTDGCSVMTSEQQGAVQEIQKKIKIAVRCPCFNHVLNLSLSKSSNVQSVRNANAVLNTLLVLKDKRNNAESNFNALLEEIMQCLGNLNIDFCTPRVDKFMKNRPNPDIHSSTEYFRITIYIPLLESIISDIEYRFQQETMDLFNLQICVPAILIHSNEDGIHFAVEILIAKYGSLFETVRDVLKSTFIAELHLWKIRWKHSKELEIPSDGLNALKQCDKMMTRRLESWLRANMGEERLSGLALMHVHKDIVINEDNIIERFAKSGVKRNMEFVM
ncbi:hypothetical protein JTB14_019762 [Gonioctena quinquepunctata]|nr:hypothetical protein JTB14_019762 [Gonioctena quinquepunctata]